MSHRWLGFTSAWSALSLIAFVGCGSDGGGTAVDDAGNTVTIDGGTTTVDSAVNTIPGEVTVVMAKGVTIPYPGQPGGGSPEQEWCEIYDLPNPDMVKVHGVRLTIDEGFSHHAIVQLVNGGPYASAPNGYQLKAGGCSAPGDDRSPILIGTQRPVLEYQFPPDVYFPMNAHQRLLINYHYINTGTTPLNTKIKIEIFHSDPAPRTQKAAALFYNWIDFAAIGAGQTSTQSQTCAPFAKNVNIVTLNGHQHKLGTMFEAFRIAGTTETKVYENVDWDNPNYQVYSPIIQINAGERLKFSCTWQNTTGSPVQFGTSKDDEMCILGGFLYPVTTDLIIDCGDTGD